MEKMSEYKAALLDPDVDPDEKVRILGDLIRKEPSTHIIQSTKIGKVIRKLAQDSSEGNNDKYSKHFFYLLSKELKVNTIY